MAIIGRFYLKRTHSGNLLGEFSNNRSLRNSTEGADLIPNPEKAVPTTSFEGEYYSTWQEDGEACFAKLTIEPKQGTENIFSLKWEGEANFWGEAFISDGMLIGDYRDFETILN